MIRETTAMATLTQPKTPEEIDVLAALDAQVNAVMKADLESYLAMTEEDVTAFEWYIQGGRIEGRELHEEMLRNMAVPDDLSWTIEDPAVRIVGEVAIVTYSLRIRAVEGKNEIESMTDETRIFVRKPERWVLAHVHKSPHGPQ